MSEQNITARLYTANLQGNKDAFGEIVQKHQNLVLATAYSITGNLQQSEDLAQETFLAAWKQLGELREIEKLPAWLCGIARNLAHNWLRRTQLERQSRSDLPITEAAAETIAPETEAESEERIALLWATLKEIPMPFREPLVMYYQQNQSVANIAAALDISEDNVRKRIARGRTFLKKEVERQVEKTLLHIRPSEHFTVAVLAALPILATGKQFLAASSAGAAAAQSASSGGAGAGHTFIAGITTFSWTLFHFVSLVVIVGVGVALGIWSGLRRLKRFLLASQRWRRRAICLTGWAFRTACTQASSPPKKLPKDERSRWVCKKIAGIKSQKLRQKQSRNRQVAALQRVGNSSIIHKNAPPPQCRPTRLISALPSNSSRESVHKERKSSNASDCGKPAISSFTFPAIIKI